MTKNFLSTDFEVKRQLYQEIELTLSRLLKPTKLSLDYCIFVKSKHPDTMLSFDHKNRSQS